MRHGELAAVVRRAEAALPVERHALALHQQRDRCGDGVSALCVEYEDPQLLVGLQLEPERRHRAATEVELAVEVAIACHELRTLLGSVEVDHTTAVRLQRVAVTRD